jgi:hypothetical protein
VVEHRTREVGVNPSSVARIRTAGALAAAVLVGGCSSSTVATQRDVRYGAPTSEMAVRGFLEGANEENFQQMGALFGTSDGPAVERFGVTDVEQRMIFLSKLLRHGSYELTQANLSQLGPDRVRYVAAMTGTRKGNVTVPIVTVPTREGRWYVEQLDVSSISASPLP